MKHDQLVGQITDEATGLGIWWHYCTDSRHCSGHPGFPDLVLIGARGALVAEVKVGDDRRSLRQVRWADRIRLASLRYQLWREGDWNSGWIQKQLREIA